MGPGVQGPEVIVGLADTDELELFELGDSQLYGSACAVKFELQPPVVTVTGLES